MCRKRALLVGAQLGQAPGFGSCHMDLSQLPLQPLPTPDWDSLSKDAIPEERGYAS
jgi:hypothetical protein